MNYAEIYRQFIIDRNSIASVTKANYHEKHHILPRSLGGKDDPDNIIVLCARDHVFAHALLAKIHGGPMWYAYWMMVNGVANARFKRNGVLVRISSRMVALARIKKSELMTKNRSGANHHFYGITRSKDVREKISATLKAKYESGYSAPSLGIKRSKETSEKLSVSLSKFYENGGESHMKGKTHSEEAREKISNAQRGEKNNNYGKPLKPDHARKIGLAQIGLNNHASDKTIYLFTHKDGMKYQGYRSEFINQYRLCKANIGRLIKCEQKSHKGWKVEVVQ